MANTEVSIKIKDQIGKNIATKLAAIGKSAGGAAAGVQKFKQAWTGIKFTGIAGLSYANLQMVKSQREAKKLAIDSRNLAIAQNQVAISTADLNIKLNRLTISEKELQAAGLGAAAAQNKAAAAQAKYANATKISSKLTTDLTKKQIQEQTVLTTLAIKQEQLAKSKVDLQIAEKRLANMTNQTTVSQNKQSVSSTRLKRTTDLASNSILRLSRNVALLKRNLFATRGAVGSTVQGLRSYISLGALVGAGGAVKGVDAYRTIENQLRQNVSGQTELNQLTKELFGVASRARVPVTSLTVAFRRYDNALAQAGQTQKQSLRITETIGKMLALNGASAQESASALLQLSQAFNKGKLDGDEFRTVAEVMPQILDALARATGKSRKELFDLSRQGELTRDILIKAFEDLEKPIDKLMKSAGRTAGQAFIELVNKIIFAFGQFDKRTGFLDKVNKLLDYMGNHIKEVVRGFQAFVAGVLSSGALAAIATLIGSIVSGVGLLAAIPATFGIFIANLIMSGEKIIVFKEGAITLKEVIDNIIFALGDFAKVGKDAFGIISKVFGKDVNQQFENLMKMLKGIGKVLVEITSSALGFSKAFFEIFNEEFPGQVIFQMSGELFNGIKKFFILLLADIVDIFSPVLARLAANIVRWSYDLAADIYNTFAKTFNLIAALLGKPLIPQIGPMLDSTFEKGLASLTRRLNQTTRDTRKVTEAMFPTKSLDKFFNTWESGYSEFRGDLQQLGLDISEGLKSAVLETRMRTMFVEMKESVMGFLVETIQTSEVLENFITGMANQFLTIAQAFDRITGNVFSVAEKISGAMSALGLVDKRGGVFGSGQGTDPGTQMLKDMESQGQQTGGALQSVFNNLSNAFQNFVRTGKLDFKELMRSILADLLKLFMNKLFQQLFSGLMGGGGGFLGGMMGFAGGGSVPSIGGGGGGFGAGGL